MMLIIGMSISAQVSKEIYTVYLIGDSGEPRTDTIDPVFYHLNNRLMAEDKEAAVIFLGDNIYHNGLPPEDRDPAYRKEAEAKLLTQLEAVEDFKGKIYFIPGNHDWNAGKPDGIDYIRAQEEFIEFYLDRGDVLIPDHGCPGPEKKKLGKDVVLIALDSQWWLHPHDSDEGSDCKNKNTDNIITELKEMLDEEDDKQVIIALHHPIYSDGSHNGDFTIRDHLFPLALLNKNLYVPLPGLGSLYPFYRTAFGAKQDIPHPLYQTLREEILEAISPYRNVVLASGHEHNQQYFYKHDNHFIKSGSGSKSAHLPDITDAVFSTEKRGYAKMIYYKDGAAKLLFYEIDDNDQELEVYSKIVIEPNLDFNTKAGAYEVEDQKLKIAIAPEYKHGSFHNFFFGDLYRDDWATPTSFRSMNLSTEKGRLKPIKVGGGYSSKSIRLKDNNGDQYVLRSLKKGVAKVVPPAFANTLVQEIFQDQISGSQPYGAIMVAPLADAVGVYHANPEIVYLPNQPMLGDYNEAYGDALYLFEERPYKDESEEEDFGNSKKIISYVDLLDKLQNNSKHHVRQEQVLRSRLFDFLLGDWDRHDDQWRWARFKEKHHEDDNKKHVFYEPIPRDRDQVFFKYKGLIPNLAKLISPETRKFQNFDYEIKNVNYLAYNARFFDRSFLNEMSRSDWTRTAKQIAEQLTDDVIATSVNQLPEEIISLRGKEYIDKLKSRRDKLEGYAIKYYNFLSKYVDVVGTDKRETFEVIRHKNGSTTIKMYQRKKRGDLGDLMYERTLERYDTKEVRLYGMKGKDVFNISGSHADGPIIRIIGGKGKDVINDTSVLMGGDVSLVVYDSEEGNEFNLGTDVLDKRSSDYKNNQYNRKEFYYNTSIGIPFIGYNPDDGLRLSYAHSISQYGFRKLPYGVKHDFRFAFATAQKELSLGYDLHIVDAIDRVDFRLQTDYFLPSYVANYFGLSNERSFDVSDEPDFNFYRYQQEEIRIQPSLEWSTLRGVSSLRVGPYYRRIDLRDNEGKFVANPALSGLTEKDFEPRNYIGINATYRLHRVDNELNPSTGVDFSISPSFNYNVSDTQESFTKMEGSLTLYNFLFVPKPFVLATKIHFGVNWGDFGFPQAQYLGRSNGLRSFFENRFGGRSSFLVSNDLRLKAFEVKSGALPFSVGVIGSFDHGRVWADAEVSDTWHTSYGGGLWFSPFDVAPISVYYMTSKNGPRQVSVSLGFSF